MDLVNDLASPSATPLGPESPSADGSTTTAGVSERTFPDIVGDEATRFEIRYKGAIRPEQGKGSVDLAPKS